MQKQQSNIDLQCINVSQVTMEMLILCIPGTLANSKDPDEMQQNAAFHQGLDCLLRFKTTFRDKNT